MSQSESRDSGLTSTQGNNDWWEVNHTKSIGTQVVPKSIGVPFLEYVGGKVFAAFVRFVIF